MIATPELVPPVAVVSGGASGIGLATVEELRTRGFAVVVFDICELPSGIEAHRYDVDVSDKAAVVSAVAEVERDLGAIEIAIACAGFLVEAPLEELTDALWQRTLDVLLGGVLHLYGAVVPEMARRGRGSLVTVASELALVGAAEHAHYVAAKAAAVGLTQSLARELAPAGLRANVVAPGPTDTPLLSERWRSDSYLAGLPLGRLAAPSEIARVIVDVADATYMTGQVVSPNGGAVIQ